MTETKPSMTSSVTPNFRYSMLASSRPISVIRKSFNLTMPKVVDKKIIPFSIKELSNSAISFLLALVSLSLAVDCCGYSKSKHLSNNLFYFILREDFQDDLKFDLLEVGMTFVEEEYDTTDHCN